MELGEKTTLTFIAQIITTVIGFVATLYFARVLGEAVLGSYFLVVAVVLWVKAIGAVSIETAVEKRISAGNDPRAYFGAGGILIAIVFVIMAALMLLFRGQVRSYVDVPVPAIIALVFGTLTFSYLGSILQAEQRVHISSLVETVDRLTRALLQIALVVVGYGLFGLLAGHVVGVVVATIVAAGLVSIKIGRPKRHHFTEIFQFAKYSWLGGITARTFASLDTLVLGVFVSTGLIGIYEIAWNVASILVIFGNSIARVMFPTISASEDQSSRVAALVEDATAFTGLFVIPGLVGSILLGQEVLGIYGSAFQKGAFILVLLVGARLLQSYTSQFTSALMAIDKPDVSFRINAVFVTVNLILNVVLVWLFGWVGAAVATLTSSMLALLLAYRAITVHIAFAVPWREIGNQLLAAVLMGCFVFFVDSATDETMVLTLVLICSGAVTYFGVLIVLSPRFRKTVARNL